MHCTVRLIIRLFVHRQSQGLEKTIEPRLALVLFVTGIVCAIRMSFACEFLYWNKTLPYTDIVTGIYVCTPHGSTVSSLVRNWQHTSQWNRYNRAASNRVPTLNTPQIDMQVFYHCCKDYDANDLMRKRSAILFLWSICNAPAINSISLPETVSLALFNFPIPPKILLL